MPEVLIIGAGLAGLACAKHLTARGVHCLVLEASDGVGGRVRTDRVEGFLLDRGFQVLLTAYPEAQAVLDYDLLSLRPFEPGALIQRRDGRHFLGDPWRRPARALTSLFSPVGTMADKLRVARMRYRAARALSGGDTPTISYLRAQGFSPAFIAEFFQPFFGGIFLERGLQTPSRMAEFVFRMMASGDTALPAEGMGAISQQLAFGLSVKLNARVHTATAKGVRLASGEHLDARAVVLATEAPEAARLSGSAPSASRSVSCLYFAAEKPPIAEPILLLNGEGQGPINNLSVPSQVAPSYAPPGAALVSATVLGMHPDEGAVREQMASWFGSEVQRWKHLRTYRIAHAQPEPAPLAQPSGVHLCGDHCESASIQGALVSGRRAAESVMRTL